MPYGSDFPRRIFVILPKRYSIIFRNIEMLE